MLITASALKNYFGSISPVTIFRKSRKDEDEASEYLGNTFHTFFQAALLGLLSNSVVHGGGGGGGRGEEAGGDGARSGGCNKVQLEVQ